VIDLQDRRISDGVQVAEAPFDLSIPRPETKELDDIIANLEGQIEQLGAAEGTAYYNMIAIILLLYHPIQRNTEETPILLYYCR